MRGSKPVGFGEKVMSKRRAHSVRSAAAAAGVAPLTRVLSSLEQRNFLHDVPRVGEDRRGDDASKVPQVLGRGKEGEYLVTIVYRSEDRID
jgi:hypothetical protein